MSKKINIEIPRDLLARLWPYVMPHIGLTGVARTLAFNSTLEEDGIGWLLVVSPSFAHMIDNERVAKVGEAVSAALGGSPVLRTIVLDVVDRRCPAWASHILEYRQPITLEVL